MSHTYPYILCLSSSIIIYNGIMFFGVWFTCIYKNVAPYRRFASPWLYDRINCQFHQSHSWVPPHIDHGVSSCPDLTLFLERGLLVVFIEYFTNTASVSFNSYISLNSSFHFDFWFLDYWLYSFSLQEVLDNSRFTTLQILSWFLLISFSKSNSGHFHPQLHYLYIEAVCLNPPMRFCLPYF